MALRSGGLRHLALSQQKTGTPSRDFQQALKARDLEGIVDLKQPIAHVHLGHATPWGRGAVHCTEQPDALFVSKLVADLTQRSRAWVEVRLQHVDLRFSRVDAQTRNGGKRTGKRTGKRLGAAVWRRHQGKPLVQPHGCRHKKRRQAVQRPAHAPSPKP